MCLACRFAIKCNSLFMDFKSFSPPPQIAPPVGDCVSLENRRNQQRAIGSGEILISWHHEPDVLRAYSTLDISENGARVVLDCYLPDGLTGLALFHRPTGIRIDRPSIVAWCRAMRDSQGKLMNYEAGIRFF